MVDKKHQTGIDNLWSQPEVNKFLNYAVKEDENFFFVFTLLTGLRIGEVLALSWSDIGLQQKTLTVSRSVSIGLNRQPRLVKKPINRTILLYDYLIAKLIKLKQKQEEIKTNSGVAVQFNNDLDLVFSNSQGEFLRPSKLRREFYKLIGKAEVKHIRLRDLRNTYAKMLIDYGYSRIDVSCLLGQNPRTLNYYNDNFRNTNFTI